MQALCLGFFKKRASINSSGSVSWLRLEHDGDFTPFDTDLPSCSPFFSFEEFSRRKVSSCKKVYESHLRFYDEKKNQHHFKVYEDKSIGFDCRYNQILKEQEMDNDVFTDEDQLFLAKMHTYDNLRSVIENFSTRNLKNKMRFKRSRSCKIK